jgi:sec-independent protein translocase protein TatA
MVTIPLFLGISGGEFFIILLVVLLLFGPGKIPEIARTIGKGMNELKRLQFEFDKQVREISRELNQQDLDKEVKPADAELMESPQEQAESENPDATYKPDDPYGLNDENQGLPGTEKASD